MTASSPSPASSKWRISIASLQEILPPNYQQLRLVGRTVLQGEKVREAKISLALVDNPTIHRINRQFLNHDEPTDVITFPLSGPSAKVLEGELVLGVEVAIELARQRGHDPHIELALYVIHGLLHLCGYDDTSPQQRSAMRQRERHYLTLLGLPDIAERD